MNKPIINISQKSYQNNKQKSKTGGSIKNIFLIILAILIVAGAFIFAEYRNKKADNIYKAEQVSISSTDTTAELDTDNDGMKDWEEILAGSDPKDAKSKASFANNTSGENLSTAQKQELSQIDLISRDFFSRYMELRQLGSANDAFSQNEIANKTIGNITLPEPAKYKLNEIITKEDGSKESVRQYANEISVIFKKYATNSRNEAVIAKNALDSEDYDILKEIDPIVRSYRGIINELIKVKAPKSIATLHLELVNAVNSTLFLAQSFRKVDVDPIAGVQAVNLYPSVERQLIDSTSAIKSYFSYLGIVFDSTEPGYLFH